MADDVRSKTRLEQAQQLFREFYVRCFWHWKPDLVITESMIPALVRGLCTYGGRKGMLAAAQLQRTEEGSA
jgi:hypothetical protein